MESTQRNTEYERGYLAALRDLKAILKSAIEIREDQMGTGGGFTQTIVGSGTGPVDGLRAG